MSVGPPPRYLRIESTVDGWVWTCRAAAFWGLRPAQRVHLLRVGLRLEGYGRRRDRLIPWSSVDRLRVVRTRDDWDKGPSASLEAGVGSPSVRRAVVARWTADGRPAHISHGRTRWEGMTLATGLRAESEVWLVAAVDQLKAVSEKRSREAEFDDIIAGRPGRAAQQELERVRGMDKD